MYGLINKAVRALIVSQYGEATWLEIVKRAGCQALFISYTSYPDETTYALVGAASDVLGVPAQDLLELVGRYWISYTRQHGYKALFDIGGSSLPEFLCNLNAMHTHIQAQFPKLRMPTFWCTDITPLSLTLHYRPGRPSRNGLAPLVVGLMKGLAEIFHLEDFEIEHTGKRTNDGARLNDDATVEFDVFQLRWESDPSDTLTPSGATSHTSSMWDLTTEGSTTIAFDDGDGDGEDGDNNVGPADKLEEFQTRWQFSLPPTRFAAAFPFHMVLSQDLKVLQVGEVLQRLCPEMGSNADFFQHWRIARPEITKTEMSFQAIKDNRDLLFLLEYKHNRRLKLRGQMNVIASSEGCHVSNPSSSGGKGKGKGSSGGGGRSRSRSGSKRHRRGEHRGRSGSKPVPGEPSDSPRCPMSASTAASSGSKSAPYNSVISVSASDVPSPLVSADMSPACPMSGLMSSASAVGVRRKTKDRSNADADRQKKTRSGESRPEENDVVMPPDVLTDSSRTVIINNLSPTDDEGNGDADGEDHQRVDPIAHLLLHQQQQQQESEKKEKEKKKKSRKDKRAKGVKRVEEFIFFLGSVQVKDNEEVVELGLSLHDFALHDSVKEVLLLSASNQTTMKDVHQMEEFILYGMESGGGGGGGGKGESDSHGDRGEGGGSNIGRATKLHHNGSHGKNKCILS